MEYGKWHVGQGNGEGSVFADDGRIKLEADVTTLYPICKVVNFNGEGKDHAHLIAAAPDLLEALKQIRRDITMVLLYKRINKRTADDLDNTAMAAIARAEGKELKDMEYYNQTSKTNVPNEDYDLILNIKCLSESHEALLEALKTIADSKGVLTGADASVFINIAQRAIAKAERKV